MSTPKEPPYSCPRIDAAIEELEAARKIHDALREWGRWWKDRCEEVERDYEKRVKSLEDNVRQLEDAVGDLERELAAANRSLDQANAEIRDLTTPPR